VLGLPVDPRSDIFSLGVVLYEMLAKRTPFERPSDTTVFSIMHRIAGEPHPPLREVDAAIPAAFDRILSKALAKKPEERYARAAEMATELRAMGRGAPAAAAPAPKSTTEFEKTVQMETISRPPTAEEAKARASLLADLERFTSNFEREEQERIRAEHEAAARKQAELQRWGEIEARKRAEFERAQERGPAAGTETDPRSATLVRRPSAIEALRQQAMSAAQDAKSAAQSREQAIATLDAALKAAGRYLEQLVKELNTVTPASGRSYEFVYLGKLAGVKLSNATIEQRPTFVDGKSVAEHIALRYRVTPAQPARATVAGDDILRCKQYLESLRAEFKAQPEQRNEAGKITRALFIVTGGLPCEIHVRGDYNAGTAMVELVNVRRVGRVQARVPVALLSDVVDDLARYAIGVDDELEKLFKK